MNVSCLEGLYPAFNVTGDGSALCQLCPTGGFCNGFDQPVPLPGFFETDSGFLECVPPEACLGGAGSPCSANYKNYLCLSCAKDHYRLDDYCKACPDLAILFIVVFVLAGIVLMLLLDAASRRRINLSAVGIGVDFCQIMSVFTSYRFAWPASLDAFFNAIQFVSINDQILAPECSFGGGPESFQRRWFVAQSLPLVVFSFAFLKMCITICHKNGIGGVLRHTKGWIILQCHGCKRRCGRREDVPVGFGLSSSGRELVSGRAHRLTSRSTATANRVLSAMGKSSRKLLYQRSRSSKYFEDIQSRGWRVLVTRRGDFLAMAHRLRSERRERVAKQTASPVDAFVATCLTSMYYLYLLNVRTMLRVFDCTDTGDGTSYMDAEPSIPCDSTGAHGTLVPYGIVSIILYTFGIPATFATLVYINRDAMRADQQLLQHGRGSSYLTNPHIAVRHRYARLYSHFKPRQFYWRVLLLIRKFTLATVAIMFDQTPFFQAAVSIGTLFMFYVLHAQFRPFLRSPRLPKSSFNVVEAALPAWLRLCSARGVKVLVKGLMLPLSFNLLETLYLGGALVVLLSGMVFESRQLDDSPILHNLLTVIVASILVLALIGFVIIALLEVFRANVRAVLEATARRKKRAIQRPPSMRQVRAPPEELPPTVTPPPSDTSDVEDELESSPAATTQLSVFHNPMHRAQARVSFTSTTVLQAGGRRRKPRGSGSATAAFVESKSAAGIWP